MFDLNAPIKPATGGNGLPPIFTPPKPFARPNGDNNGAGKVNQETHKPSVAKNIQAPVITRPAYPKPRLWVENRIALCERHHIIFNQMRRDFRAKLQAFIQSQPGYDPAKIAHDAYMAKLRRNRLSA